jgi:hypothetical protein
MRFSPGCNCCGANEGCSDPHPCTGCNDAGIDTPDDPVSVDLDNTAIAWFNGKTFELAAFGRETETSCCVWSYEEEVDIGGSRVFFGYDAYSVVVSLEPGTLVTDQVTVFYSWTRFGPGFSDPPIVFTQQAQWRSQNNEAITCQTLDYDTWEHLGGQNPPNIPPTGNEDIRLYR